MDTTDKTRLDEIEIENLTRDEPSWLDRKQPNALNLLRLVFAITVLFCHSWSFGRFPNNPLAILNPIVGDAAANAVNGFFIISGFLITASWLSRRSTESYLRARISRIWPAFAVAFVVSALLTAVAAGPDGMRYLRSIPKQSWVVGIFTLDPFELERPLSFVQNPYPRTVNGPMWTIRLEFCCYLAVALAGVVGVYKRRWIAIAFTIFAMALAAYENLILPELAWQRWARFAAFFGAGSAVYLFRKHIPKSGWLATISAGVLLCTPFFSPYITLPTAGAYLIFYLAYSAPNWAKDFGAKNDISYGTYLYGGVLQQFYYSLSVRGLLPHDPWVNFIAVLPASLVFGWLSWVWIEKPAKQWMK